MHGMEWVRQTVERVKEDGTGNIRVHPNGFIQLDLLPVARHWRDTYQQGHSGATLRLHIWNPPVATPLPHQGTVNEVHTHVFDMSSTVVKGRMEQRIYSFVVGSEWHLHRSQKPHRPVKLYKAVYNKSSDSRLEDTGILGIMIEDFHWGIHEGQSYTQPAFTFHDSDARNCVVTVMEKTTVHEGDAYVLVPDHIEPDNSYDRANAAPVGYLWDAVEAAIA